MRSIDMIKKALPFLILFALSVQGLLAQDFRGGGGLVYGTVAKNVGLNFRGDVLIDRQWSISPHFNWFFNRENGPFLHRWNALNIDAHYYFEVDDTWHIYPLFGVNFATVSEKFSGVTYSNSFIGANLGAGTEYEFDERLSGFGEVKYVIGDADQAVFTLGVLYQINK